MESLYSLPKPLLKATVLSRPSKKIKSPYLADILIDSKEYLCHSGSLGCSGHIVEGSIVWVLEKESSTAKSTHEIYLIEENNVMIGCHPLIANKIAYKLLKKNLVLPNTTNIIAEQTINDSRFDFIVSSDSRMSIIEVKSVPIADYFDGTTKEVANYLKEFTCEEKIAIFPYCTVAGKRTLSSTPLSDRALKHVEGLTSLVKSYKCMLLFLVQRNDVSKFCVTKLDPTYKEACKKALNAGVVFKAISIRWDNQHAYYEKELEIIW